MKVFENIQDWISLRRQLKQQGSSIGFIPTMGALHAGHISLVEKAKKENSFALTSIFVNPTQFNLKEDLEKYPRTISEDLEKLSACGADAVLLPSEKDIYADDFRYKVSEAKDSRLLCGAYRPGHFDGVLTVMLKLLSLAQAERCYMGEKDFQQYCLVKDMTESFFIDTRIIPCPIIREKSGLAMSSRNTRLSAEAREKRAPLIYKFLQSGKSPDEIKSSLEQNGFKVEYAEDWNGRRLVAAWLENVRLIDNVKI